MMTKIVYWNIQKFSQTKLSKAQTFQDGRNNKKRWVAQSSADCKKYILDIFSGKTNGNPDYPDIFIIVEVTGATDEVINSGTLNGSPGGNGARDLLTAIRARAGDQWCLVPPLYSGSGSMRESIAVYFNSANLQFIGPYKWVEKDGVGTAVPSEYMADAIEYKGIWADAIWPDEIKEQAFPDLEIPNRGLNSNQVAGQWQFMGTIKDKRTNQNKSVILNFPTARNRTPFLTQFLDLKGNRMIRVFTTHTSPKTAKQAVSNIGRIDELVQHSPNRYVDVVLGDFNVDSFTAFGLEDEDAMEVDNADNKNSYRLLLNDGFIMAFPPYDPNRGNEIPDPNLIPFSLTHFLPSYNCPTIEAIDPKTKKKVKIWVSYATPIKTDTDDPDEVSPTQNVYPRYGYMGGIGVNQKPNSNDAIDNIFTRYGAQNDNQNEATRATIINTITGTPYALVGYPNMYPDQYSYSTTLSNKTLAEGVSSDLTERVLNSKTTLFRQWDNFSKIFGTSDHLPLAIDV